MKKFIKIRKKIQKYKINSYYSFKILEKKNFKQCTNSNILFNKVPLTDKIINKSLLNYYFKIKNLNKNLNIYYRDYNKKPY